MPFRDCKVDHGHTVESLIAFEDSIAEAYNAGQIKAPVHLSNGDEDVLLEIFNDVRDSDWVFTTWRSHYHCLLKGVPPDRLRADILAGKSITLNYPEYRIVSSAIVGAVCAQALGVAFAITEQGSRERVFCFVGDMAMCGGAFQEASRYSAGFKDMPIAWIIADNGKSVDTPTQVVWRKPMYMKSRGYNYESKWPHSGTGTFVNF